MNYLVLSEKTSLEDAIKLLDQNGNGFLPVIDKDKVLLGIITDGDLRRGILNKTLNLEGIINTHPIVEKAGTSKIQIKQKLRELHRRHMPVVDESGHLIEVVVLEEFEFMPKRNWVVVMAGGLGTRLGELTKDKPKPMLELGRKPILHGIVDHFKSLGFTHFVFCVNYKSEIIENYFGDGSGFGIVIRYTKETKRMGTAGALSLIDFDMEAPFFVVNGDILTSINFDDVLNFHEVNKTMATMCVKKVNFDIPYATVDFNEESKLLKLAEKPTIAYYVNAGMYVLQPETLNEIPKDTFFDMPDLFQKLLDKNQTPKVFPISEYWLDVGKPDDLMKGIKDSKIG